MRAAVGIEQDGQLATRLAVLGEEQRGPELARPDACQLDLRLDQGTLGVGSDYAIRLTGPRHPSARRGSERRAAHDERESAADRAVHAWLGGDVRDRAVEPDLHHVLFGRLVDGVREDVHAVVLDSHDLAHLQIGWRQRHAVDEHPPHPVAVARGHETVAGPRGRALDDLDPRVVVVLRDDPRRQRCAVGAQHLRRTLVT